MFPLLVQPWFTTGYHGCGCRWWVFHRLGDWRLVVFRYEEPIAHLWGFFVPMKTGILPWGTSGPWGSIRGPGKQHYTSTCRSLFGSQTGWQDGLVNKNIFISYKMGIFHQCTSEWWFQSYLFIFTKWITMTRFAKWSTDRRRIRNQSQVVCAKATKATKARPFFAESWLRILDQNGPTKTWHEDGLCFVLFVYCIHIYIYYITTIHLGENVFLHGHAGLWKKVCWMLQRAVCRSWWEKRGLALFQWSGWSQWSGIDHQVWNIRGITERLWHRDILQKCVHDTTRLGMVWWSLQLHSQLTHNCLPHLRQIRYESLGWCKQDREMRFVGFAWNTKVQSQGERHLMVLQKTPFLCNSKVLPVAWLLSFSPNCGAMFLEALQSPFTHDCSGRWNLARGIPCRGFNTEPIEIGDLSKPRLITRGQGQHCFAGVHHRGWAEG